MFGELFSAIVFGGILGLLATIWYSLNKLHTKMTQKYKDAVQAGKMTFANDGILGDNPYPAGSLLHKFWVRGYEKGRNSRERLLKRQIK